MIADAIASGVRLHDVFVAAGSDTSWLEKEGFRPIAVNDRALARLSGTDTPQGPIAVAGIPPAKLDRSTDLLVAWGVSNPGNVGALVRVAAAFGWGLAVAGESADPWSPKSVRAGAGAQYLVPIGKVESVGDLEGWLVAATAAGDHVPPEAIKADRVALLIGEEGGGLAEGIISSADRVVSIPMRSRLESLNAAVAAGIIVYVLHKRQGDAEGPV